VDSELIKVYPNPASDETVVSFQVVSPGHVRISLYDAKGQEIIILVDEYRLTGNYSHSINTRGLQAGSYICLLKQNDQTSPTRIVIVK
jgi:hypothetical protein